MSDQSATGTVEAIQAARAEARKYRIFFAVLVATFFGVFGTQIYMQFASFDDQELMIALDRRMVRDVWPSVTSELDQVRVRVTPGLIEQFGAGLEATGPKMLKALEAEGDRLQTQLAKKPEEALTRVLALSRPQHRKVIANAFPQLAETAPARIDAMTDAVQNRIRQWSILQFTGVLDEVLKSMVAMKATLDALEPTADAAERPKPEEVLELFLQLMNARLEGGGSK